MTKISHIATIHRKPKDAYVPELTPSAIDIPADLNGKPIFLDSEKNTPSISHSYVTGFDTFSFPSDTIVDSSKYPNYTTFMSDNAGKENSIARIRFTFTNIATLKLVYSSYAESTYDYIMLSKLDQAFDGTEEYSSNKVAYSTYGRQSAAIDKEAIYEIPTPTKTHFIDVMFRKNGSTDVGTDRGYIAIPLASSLPVIKTISVSPSMQNAAGDVVFDYTDERLSLPADSGLTFYKSTPLIATIKEGTAVKSAILRLPVKDNGGAGGTQVAELPVRISYSGKDADTITVSAACHDGSKGNSDLCYVMINGVKITETNVYSYVWNSSTNKYDKVSNGYTSAEANRGMNQFFIDAETMQCIELNHYDTYLAGSELISNDQLTLLAAEMLIATSAKQGRYKNNAIIMVIVAADASGCNQSIRDYLNSYGGGLTDTYSPSRKRHYFVTNINNVKSGQAYEEISSDSSQKIVTFSVNRGVGVVLQGAKGTQGSDGFEGCFVRRTEWEAGKLYRNDSARTTRDPETGLYIIDEVTVSTYNGGDGYSYLCKTEHLSTAENKPAENLSGDGDTNWRKLEVRAPMKISFADIQQAIISYLQSKQIVITDSLSLEGENTPYGAFGGGYWPLWFGGANPEQAVTKVNRWGHMYSQAFITQGKDAHIEVRDGLLKVYGSDTQPNIVFGVDENGYAVLSYYVGGELLYNLGPQGIMSQIEEKPCTMTVGMSNVRLITNSYTLSKTFTASNQLTLYKFQEGYKRVGGVMKYMIGRNGNYNLPSSYHNRYFRSADRVGFTTNYDGSSHDIPASQGKPAEGNTPITNAIYFSGFTMGGTSLAGYGEYEVYYFNLNGLIERYIFYLKSNGSNSYTLCDTTFTEIDESSITLENYLKKTGQA